MNQQPTIDEADATERSRIIAMIAAGPIGQVAGKRPKAGGAPVPVLDIDKRRAARAYETLFVKDGKRHVISRTDGDMEIWRRAVAVWVQEKMPRIRKIMEQDIKGTPYGLDDLRQSAYCLAYEAFEAMRKDRRLKFEGCFWSLMESWKWSTLKKSVLNRVPLERVVENISAPAEKEETECRREDSYVREALKRLSPSEQSIALHLKDGWSRRQIAERLGISEKTLLNRIALANRKIARR